MEGFSNPSYNNITNTDRDMWILLYLTHFKSQMRIISASIGLRKALLPSYINHTLREVVIICGGV